MNCFQIDQPYLDQVAVYCRLYARTAISKLVRYLYRSLRPSHPALSFANDYLGFSGMYSLAVTIFLASLSCLTAKWVDMSYDFDNQTIYWPGFKRFNHALVHKGMTQAGYYYTSYDISAAEHGGSHIDAPIHFYEGRTLLLY